MFDSNAFVKSELDYRTNRIRAGLKGRRRERTRRIAVRRPAEATENAR